MCDQSIQELPLQSSEWFFSSCSTATPNRELGPFQNRGPLGSPLGRWVPAKKTPRQPYPRMLERALGI